MARTCSNAALDTITGRRRLAPRKASYWRSIRLGLRMGWRRRVSDASGTWLCRLALPGNDVRQKVLGGADDHPIRADGVTVLTYAQAVDLAQEWAGTVLSSTEVSSRGAARQVDPTVIEALRDYRATKVASGQTDRASATATLIKQHLPADIAVVRCSELTEQVLKGWLRARTDSARAEIAMLSRGTRDKLRGIMGAALRAAGAPEQAVQLGLNAAASAGSSGQRSEATARHTILDIVQIARLHAAVANIDADLSLLVRTLSETGSRPVQLLGCTIRDLDPVHCLLHIPASAKGKPGASRRSAVSVPISPELAQDLAAAAIRDCTAQRLFTWPLRIQTPGAFAIWQDTGDRTGWTKNVWCHSFHEAVSAAGLPADTTLYSLRHSHIVSLIQANVPLRVIASMCDTSTAMIETHYSRWIARTAGAVDQVRRALAFGRTAKAVA